MSSNSRNNGSKTGTGNPPLGHRFKPGNPGRPKGSRNRLGEDFIRALAEDFEKHGPSVIEKVRTDRPADYLKIVASLLPKDVNLNVNFPLSGIGASARERLADSAGRRG